MSQETIARTMLINRTQVQYACDRAREKLGGNNGTATVAIAWRLGLIAADEIEGGPIVVEEVDRAWIEESLSSAALSFRRRRPPVESWEALRARCKKIGHDVRSRRSSRPPVTGTARTDPEEPLRAALPMESSR
jgi:hypothetical protein